MTDLSASFFGFRSNLLGTHFTIYDHGESPKKGHAMPDQANLRREVAAVCYVRQSASLLCTCVCITLKMDVIQTT